MPCRDEMTLAERCYDRSLAEDELFATIHRILGGTSLDNCLCEEFEWRVIDTDVDSYDDSVEVILKPGSLPLNREEVDKILELGFGQVWESIGETGRQWTKLRGPMLSHPRQPSDESPIQLQKLRQRVKQLEDELEHKHPYRPSQTQNHTQIPLG